MPLQGTKRRGQPLSTRDKEKGTTSLYKGQREGDSLSLQRTKRRGQALYKGQREGDSLSLQGTKRRGQPLYKGQRTPPFLLCREVLRRVQPLYKGQREGVGFSIRDKRPILYKASCIINVAILSCSPWTFLLRGPSWLPVSRGS